MTRSNFVRCTSCEQDVHIRYAQRRMTCWVPVANKGGTLSNVEELTETGEYRCQDCRRAALGQSASLFGATS